MQWLGIWVALLGSFALSVYWEVAGLGDPSTNRSVGGSTAPYLLPLVLLGIPLFRFARHDSDFYDLTFRSRYVPRSRLVDVAVVGVFVGIIAAWGQLMLTPALDSRVMEWQRVSGADLGFSGIAAGIVTAYYMLAGLILLVFFIAKCFTPVYIPTTASDSHSSSS
ncbi:hypothetical protein [Microbacterium sp. GXF6406]